MKKFIKIEVSILEKMAEECSSYHDFHNRFYIFSDWDFERNLTEEEKEFYFYLLSYVRDEKKSFPRTCIASCDLRELYGENKEEIFKIFSQECDEISEREKNL